jgi:hypothetical protein
MVKSSIFKLCETNGALTDTVTLLKPIHKTSLLIPYEQFFIQTYQYKGALTTEQNRGEQNPLL